MYPLMTFFQIYWLLILSTIIRLLFILRIRFINELSSKVSWWFMNILKGAKRVVRLFLSQLLLELSGILVLLYLIHIVFFPLWLKAVRLYITLGIKWMSKRVYYKILLFLLIATVLVLFQLLFVTQFRNPLSYFL